MRYHRRARRHQVKSRWYYVFWFIMAVSVVSGQVYVGSSYRILSKELRSFSQSVYDTQMGWDAHQQRLEQQAQSYKPNKSLKFDESLQTQP